MSNIFFFIADHEGDGSPTTCSWCRKTAPVVTFPLAGTKEAEADPSNTFVLHTFGLCEECLNALRAAFHAKRSADAKGPWS